MKVLVTQSCPSLCDPMDCSLPAPLFMGFSRQEHWNGLPFPSPGDLPNPGIDLRSPALRQILSCLSHRGIHFSSDAQSCPTLCDPMNRSTPGRPVHHQLPEFTQTHVHRVINAIHASHPLSSPSPPAFILSHHQGLLQ